MQTVLWEKIKNVRNLLTKMKKDSKIDWGKTIPLVEQKNQIKEEFSEMNKKIFAGVLASALAVTCAANVSALQTELDCSGWWTAHTDGVEITADGVEVTFTSTTYADAANNWNAPIYVVYSGDEAKVNGAGYAEYYVCRADMYGWVAPDLGDYNTNGDLPAGWSWERTAEPDWDNWLANCQAGVSGTVKATKGNGNVTVVFTVNGATSTTVIPVDSDTVYVSLSGELCKLSNIKLVDNTPAAPSGGDNEGTSGNEGNGGAGDPNNAGDPNKDSADTGVEGVAVAAGLAIIAAGAVVVAKKRK